MHLRLFKFFYASNYTTTTPHLQCHQHWPLTQTSISIVLCLHLPVSPLMSSLSFEFSTVIIFYCHCLVPLPLISPPLFCSSAAIFIITGLCHQLYHPAQPPPSPLLCDFSFEFSIISIVSRICFCCHCTMTMPLSVLLCAYSGITIILRLHYCHHCHALATYPIILHMWCHLYFPMSPLHFSLTQCQ